ncbi:MAG: hypothetical protein JWL77_4902 [Chthonomonadaceae bacterium]|nr:hypothetical protein [Chthonomonadaceae bacterium]
MPTLIQNVIATRSMIWTRTDGATFPVDVYVGDLVFIASTDPDLSDYWQASTQVLDPSIDDSVVTCGGDDSVQALFHALFRAGDILSSSIIASQIDYSVIPNFGFPVLPANNPPPPNVS